MTDNVGVGAGLNAAASGLATAAGAAESAVENVMKVEPMVAGIAGMFVPQVALIQPWIVMAAPYLERALKDIQNSNGGDVLNAFIELMQHVSKGGPSSPALSESSAAQQGGG